MTDTLLHAFDTDMLATLKVFAICVGLVVMGFVITWIALKRSNDKLRRPRATLADARAVYADEDFQDDMTVIPPALRQQAEG